MTFLISVIRYGNNLGSIGVGRWFSSFGRVSSRLSSGPGSIVSIATGYRLDGPGIESWWEGARFSAPVQTSPGVHPASCTMGTGSFPGG